MDKDVSPSKVCKLRTRYWLITDGDGKRQEVSGEGVIGQYPLIRPGLEHVYCSACPLSTTSGTMEGHFQFVVMETREIITVPVGRFILSI